MTSSKDANPSEEIRKLFIHVDSILRGPILPPDSAFVKTSESMENPHFTELHVHLLSYWTGTGFRSWPVLVRTCQRFLMTETVTPIYIICSILNIHISFLKLRDEIIVTYIRRSAWKPKEGRCVWGGCERSIPVDYHVCKPWYVGFYEGTPEAQILRVLDLSAEEVAKPSCGAASACIVWALRCIRFYAFLGAGRGGSEALVPVLSWFYGLQHAKKHRK